MKTDFKNKGVTLVELVASFGIAAMLILMVASVYVAHFRLFSNQNDIINIASDNKLALDEITNQIRESVEVVNTCPSCTAEETTNTANQPSSVLVISLWPIDTNQTPFQPGAVYDYIIYKVDSEKRLVKKTIPYVGAQSSTRQAGENIIASNVQALEFTFNSTTASLITEVNTKIQTQKKTLDKTHTLTESTKAILRNK